MNLFLRSATLSWPTLALLAVAGLLAALGGNPAATATQRLAWLGIGVIAQISLTLVYRIAAWIGMDRWRGAVFLIVVAGGAARALTIGLLVPAVGAGDPLDLGQRTLVGTVTFTAWGLILGAVVQAWSDYRTALRSLLSRVDRSLAEAEAFTREWGVRLSRTSMTTQSLTRAAADLHADIERRLRPVSHRLWFGVSNRQTMTRFFRALVDEPLPLSWIALTMLVLYTWNTTPHFGFLLSLSVAGVTVGLIVLLLAIGQFFAVRFPQSATVIRVASLMLSAVVSLVVDWLSSGWADGPGITVVAIGLVTIIVGFQIIAVSVRQRRETLEVLGARVDALESRRAEIATDLHSRLQSRWTAAALRLQEAAETGDLTAAQQALSGAQALVDSTHSTPVPESTDLTAIAQAWEGIAAVRITVPALLPSTMNTTVSRLIEEAIANAVRHGHARTIDVLVTVSATTIDVVVTDDGSGVQEGGRAGLGSSWLDGVAVWSLEDSGAGARLSARLPLVPG